MRLAWRIDGFGRLMTIPAFPFPVLNPDVYNICTCSTTSFLNHFNIMVPTMLLCQQCSEGTEYSAYSEQHRIQNFA
jgi:hypothetical protein